MSKYYNKYGNNKIKQTKFRPALHKALSQNINYRRDLCVLFKEIYLIICSQYKHTQNIHRSKTLLLS